MTLKKDITFLITANASNYYILYDPQRGVTLRSSNGDLN